MHAKITIPVISARAVIMLGGMLGMMKGPTTRVGMTVIRSMLFSLAKSHAAFSARDFETKYIWTRTSDKL